MLDRTLISKIDQGLRNVDAARSRAAERHASCATVPSPPAAGVPRPARRDRVWGSVHRGQPVTSRPADS
jgi:hypothetical protein